MTTDVLIVGKGAREHALAWKLRQSSKVGRMFVTPGNPGTAAIADNVPISVMDITGLADFASDKKIGLTVVGPDDPLAAGIVNKFREYGLNIFGPTKEAAKLEWSKAYAKNFMSWNGIPTAEFRVFKDPVQAVAHVRARGAPIVVKASGLALGKGVFVCHSVDGAEAAIKTIMVDRAFKSAGDQVVIEEFLEGEEFSVQVVTEGTEAPPVLLPVIKDYKRLNDGNKGPNTGGMGSILAPASRCQEFLKEVMARVVAPTLAGLRQFGTPYTGCLYPGIILTASGPKVLEFNSRFGDPETQSLVRVLGADFFDLLDGCARGRMPTEFSCNSGLCAATVVLSARGYPEEPGKGQRISGLDAAREVPGVEIFHSGTYVRQGVLVTHGGRVLSVSAVGYSQEEARDRAYQAARLIRFDGAHLRHDIGFDVKFPH